MSAIRGLEAADPAALGAEAEMKCGQSDVLPIKRLLLKHARDAFIGEDEITRSWRDLSYTGRPDFERAVEEYDGFVGMLEGLGVEPDFLPASEGVSLDSIYTRDATIICDRGAVLCNMTKVQRRGEPAAMAEALHALGIPIHGAVTGAGRLEGGDAAWVDERTLAVGLSRRTNREGIGQLRESLGDCIDELIVVPLPDYRPPGDVFHLMSIFDPVDRDLALVYARFLPDPFRDALLAKGIELIEVPDSEFVSMACNVLTVAPRVCVALAGNPLTRAALEDAGVEVHTYEGHEISVKGAGGPTCLTRPLIRA